MSFLIEKLLCSRVDPWLLEISLIACRVEGFWGLLFLAWFPLIEYHVVLIGQPPASIEEVEVQYTHDEVDGSSRLSTDEAFERVFPHEEGKARVCVIVEGAKAVVPRNS